MTVLSETNLPDRLDSLLWTILELEDDAEELSGAIVGVRRDIKKLVRDVNDGEYDTERKDSN